MLLVTESYSKWLSYGGDWNDTVEVQVYRVDEIDDEIDIHIPVMLHQRQALILALDDPFTLHTYIKVHDS